MNNAFVTNVTNVTCLLDETFLTIMMPPALSIIFILAASFNSVALWILCFHVKKKAPIDILMTNLCVGDLVFSLTYPLIIIYHSNNNHWIFGNFMCKLQTFLIYFTLLTSVFFLMCISIFRCYMIIQPFQSQHKITKKFTIVLSVLIWLLAAGFMSPAFLRINVFEMNGTLYCMSFNQPNVTKQFQSSTILLFILSFVIPFGSLLMSSLLIQRKLANSTATSRSQRGQHAVKMVTVILCIFVICFLPANIMRLTLSVVDRNDCTLLQRLGVTYYCCVLGLYLNNVLDPIVYFYAGTKYRSKLINVFRCKKHHITPRSAPPSDESQL
ncbi:P2Y purinoceptor 1-like [Scyliorhinus canicula]|uniref:P2Y purinoceptor 1-like n=1 Tax=Scyliorhinus canicula TaxID=7830 RepID=UPI0018F5BD76|nr:P2Y purinoceptor 1-like [Scyliorhinus canicula]